MFKFTAELGDVFSAKVQKLGYQTIGYAESEYLVNIHRLDVYQQDKFICSFEASGELSPNVGGLYADSIKELQTLFLETREVYVRYRDATPLKCDGVTDYRVISQFADVLLAAHLEEDNEIRFVTWCYNYDCTGVVWGHYFDTDYDGAKRDFVTRSGLIQEKQLFGEEELTLLRDSCVYCTEYEQDMSFDEERRLEKLVQKLESNLKKEA